MTTLGLRLACKASDQQILRAYAKTHSVWKAGKILGMCGQSVHERLQKLAVSTRDPNLWTAWQIKILKDEYQKDFIRLDDLVKRIGKHKANICRKAGELGLTKQKRKGISKYDLPLSSVIELFEEFVYEQPITLTQYARNKGLWPHGLSQLFRKHGYACRVSELIRKRRQLPENIRIRFEKRFIKGHGCWEWNGARDNHGYGRFSAFGTSKAHRVSYQVYREEPDRKLLVCHHCDNPPCVRPDHLFLGTAKDNAQDAVRKGRMGRMNGKQK